MINEKSMNISDYIQNRFISADKLYHWCCQTKQTDDDYENIISFAWKIMLFKLRYVTANDDIWHVHLINKEVMRKVD